MLQLAHRTLAPRSTKVSMRIAVSVVMCSEPVTRTPLSGLVAAYFFRIDMRPGISCSETWMVLRPHSARLMSLTLKSAAPLPFLAARRFLGDLGSFTVAISVEITLRWELRLLHRALEGGSLVGAFPSDGVEIINFAEVAVVGGLRVDGAKQVELLDDGGRLEAEHFTD